MFVPSGTIGNYFFAFRDLVDVGLHIVRRYIDRAGDVTLGVLLGGACVDEDGGLCVEVFFRVSERDPSGVVASSASWLCAVDAAVLFSG